MSRLEEIENKINKRIQEKYGEELKTRKYLYSDEVLPIVYEERGMLRFHLWNQVTRRCLS